MTPDQAAVRAALTALDDAFQRQDVDTVLGLCTDDVVFVGSGEGEEAVGRDGFLRMLAALGARAEGVTFTTLWDHVQVDVLADVALISAWGVGRLVSPRREAETRYRLTGVLIRAASGDWRWRVYHGSEPAAW